MAKRRRSRRKVEIPDLDIVIPVYGQGDKLRECLRCLEASDTEGLRYQIILVDDRSPEPNTIPPESELPDGTKVLYNEHNSGFPFTANRGARLGRAPLILFLNSDCFLEPNAIAEMVKPLSDEHVGIVGPKLLFPPDSPFTSEQYVPWLKDLNLDRSNLIQHAGLFFGWAGPEHIRLHWPGDHPKVNIQSYVQAVTGACLLTRRKTWDAVRSLWPPEDPSDGGFNLIYGRGCLAADTMIYTNQGLRQLADLMGPLVSTSLAEIEVGSIKDAQAATLAYRNGYDETLQVSLEKGFKIRGTPDHKVIIMSQGGKPIWREIENLKPGDYVAIKVGADLWGKREIPLDDAYFLGLYTAEGSTEMSRRGEAKRITITSTDQEVWAFLKNAGFKQQRQEIHWRSIGGKRAMKKWMSYGLDPTEKALNKTVPQAILDGTKDVVKAYLQGLFDGDGSGHVDGRVSYATHSETLARQVQMLLLNFGLVTGLYRKPSRAGNDGWSLELGRDMEAFYDVIGFRIARKQANKRLARPGRSYVVPFHRQYVKTAYDSVPPGVGKNATHARFAHNPSPHIIYKGIGEMVDFCDKHDTATPNRLKECLREGYYWAKVRQIEGPFFEETFDLHVPTNHAYVANGLLVHNTYEDVEYCVLARSKGYEVVYQPTARGIHYAGASVRGADLSYDLDGNRQLFFFRVRQFSAVLQEGRPLFHFDAFMHY